MKTMIRNLMRPMLVATASVGLFATACTGDPKPAAPVKKVDAAPKAPATPKVPATPTAAKSPADEAKEIFTTRCVLCHGATGKGDGVGAAGLDPKPRDMTLKEWQTKVTDEHITKVIVGGGPAVKLSAMMPPNPDLAGKKDVVAELVKLVRAMGK